MTHLEKITRWIGPGSIGTEIGAGHSPLPGLDPPPIYVDCFKDFGGAPAHAEYYGHAAALPFHANSLDYVATSHVLEHTANPVAALAEWYRVLRPGGIIYLVVPDRRQTWDRGRELTPVAHLLDDFVRGTTSCDPTHVDEFVHGLDWSLYSPTTPPGDIPAERTRLARGMHEAIARGEGINIHFHTFEPQSLIELLETLQTWPTRRFRWEILDHAEYFPAETPNGILAVLRVKKTWSDVAVANTFRRQHPDRARAVLRDDAEPFSSFTRKPIERGGVE